MKKTDALVMALDELIRLKADADVILTVRNVLAMADPESEEETVIQVPVTPATIRRIYDSLDLAVRNHRGLVTDKSLDDHLRNLDRINALAKE